MSDPLKAWRGGVSGPPSGEGRAGRSTLDLRGIRCPLSWAKAKVNLERLSRGEELTLLLDDPKGVRDVPRAATGSCPSPRSGKCATRPCSFRLELAPVGEKALEADIGQGVLEQLLEDGEGADEARTGLGGQEGLRGREDQRDVDANASLRARLALRPSAVTVDKERS